MSNTFTTIKHDVRRLFELTLNEYAICDSIFYLSQSDEYNFTCMQSKENIGDWIGVSRQSAYNIINKLLEKGLIIKKNDGYCTTKKWKDAVSKSEKGECQESLQCKKSLQKMSKNFTDSVKKLDKECKETLHNKDIINTNKDINKDKLELPVNLDNDQFRDVYNQWYKFRKEIKKKLTPIMIEKQIKKLSKYPLETAIEMLEQSMENGWQGIFEINKKQILSPKDRVHLNVLKKYGGDDEKGTGSASDGAVREQTKAIQRKYC